MRESARWRTGRGMKMQKGAGGLAQYRSGGASAFILFFVRRRVVRSFFQDGRVARVRRCITSVTWAPRERRQRHPTLPIEKEMRLAPSAAWRVSRSLLRGYSETSILVCEVSGILYRKLRRTFKKWFSYVLNIITYIIKFH